MNGSDFCMDYNRGNSSNQKGVQITNFDVQKLGVVHISKPLLNMKILSNNWETPGE